LVLAFLEHQQDQWHQPNCHQQGLEDQQDQQDLLGLEDQQVQQVHKREPNCKKEQELSCKEQEQVLEELSCKKVLEGPPKHHEPCKYRPKQKQTKN
jgi:hypothetical protein